jgi:hypothetical protein
MATENKRSVNEHRSRGVLLPVRGYLFGSLSFLGSNFNGGDQPLGRAADGFERIAELISIDVVRGEIVGCHMLNSEMAHDDIGRRFGFQFALAACFSFGV